MLASVAAAASPTAGGTEAADTAAAEAMAADAATALELHAAEAAAEGSDAEGAGPSGGAAGAPAGAAGSASASHGHGSAGGGGGAAPGGDGGGGGLDDDADVPAHMFDEDLEALSRALEPKLEALRQTSLKQMAAAKARNKRLHDEHVVALTQEHRAELARKQAEADDLRASLLAAEALAQRRGLVIERVTRFLGATVARREATWSAPSAVHRAFSAWRSWKDEELSARRGARRAGLHHRRALLHRVTTAWRGVAVVGHRSRVDAFWESKLDEAAARLIGEGQRRAEHLEGQLLAAEAEIADGKRERARLEEEVKALFLRGVSHMNVEALALFARSAQLSGGGGNAAVEAFRAAQAAHEASTPAPAAPGGAPGASTSVLTTGGIAMGTGRGAQAQSVLLPPSASRPATATVPAAAGHARVPKPDRASKPRARTGLSMRRGSTGSQASVGSRSQRSVGSQGSGRASRASGSSGGRLSFHSRASTPPVVVATSSPPRSRPGQGSRRAARGKDGVGIAVRVDRGDGAAGRGSYAIVHHSQQTLQREPDDDDEDEDEHEDVDEGEHSGGDAGHGLARHAHVRRHEAAEPDAIDLVTGDARAGAYGDDPYGRFQAASDGLASVAPVRVVRHPPVPTRASALHEEEGKKAAHEAQAEEYDVVGGVYQRRAP